MQSTLAAVRPSLTPLFSKTAPIADPEACADAKASRALASELPEWGSNMKNLNAEAAVLWGQVIRAVQISGHNLVKPPRARGPSQDWVRDGSRMQMYMPSRTALAFNMSP